MKGSTWVKLALFLVVVIGIGLGLKALGFGVTQMTPDRVREFVLSFGVWAPVVYLVGYGQPIVLFPASILTATAGLAFGPWWGTVAAVIGATARACTQFLVARLLGREAVAKLLKGKAAALDEKIGAEGFKTVLLIRLLPNIPYDMQNYGLGFSRVRFGPYVLATFLGILPGSFAYVYLGHSLSDPKQIWKLILATLLILGLMAVTSAWKRRRAAPTAGRG